VHAYAQTNLQLFEELRREGYARDDFEAVARAYELTMSLFTGRFRASGKTFIAHLVGTAGILASLRAPSPLVVAGLLHAAYAAGDFGDEEQGISEAKRERIREVAGERAEEYVHRYQCLEWSDETIDSVAEGLDQMTPADRDVVLMRLANELEEFLDLGLHYGGERRRAASSGDRRCRLMIDMAQRLGYPRLSEELARIIDESGSAAIETDFLPGQRRNTSFVLAPRSYQRLKDALDRRLAGRR